MKAKNVSSIFFSKFSLVYKMILFLLIITILMSILGLGIILPVLNGLRKDLISLNLSENTIKYVKAIISGKNADAAFNVLFDSVKLIPDVIQKWDINVVISIVVLIFIVFVFALLYYMAYYSMSDIIHQFMSSNSKFGFMSNYLYNGRKSFLFAITYAPIAILYFIVMGMIVIGLSILFSKISPYLGVVSGYFLFIFGLALRRSLFALWIPSMVVDGMSATDALKKNFSLLKGRFGKLLGEYFMICIVGVIITIVVSIATATLGIIIAYSIIWIVMEIMDMVEYYLIKEYKFYIDDQTVFNPKKKFKDAVLDDTYSL